MGVVVDESEESCSGGDEEIEGRRESHTSGRLWPRRACGSGFRWQAPSPFHFQLPPAPRSRVPDASAATILISCCARPAHVTPRGKKHGPGCFRAWSGKARPKRPFRPDSDRKSVV